MTRTKRRSAVMAAIVASVWCPAARAGSCPADMVAIEDFCIDLYEAPNQADTFPLVMYTYAEATAWCQQRGRRLCFDDEWSRACGGADDSSYPYGDTHLPGTCNDEEVWAPFNQTLLNGWPAAVSTSDVESLGDLLDAARAHSPAGGEAADHVEDLYQGEGSGMNVGCESAEGVVDLCGNIEEWTQRRDGGVNGFNGNHKGRYWAEARTCQQSVTSHGNAYRFYQLGFRCCRDQTGGLPIFSDGFETSDLSLWSGVVP